MWPNIRHDTQVCLCVVLLITLVFLERKQMAALCNLSTETQGISCYHRITGLIWGKNGKRMQKARKNVGNKKEKFVKRQASKEITGIPVGIKHT